MIIYFKINKFRKWKVVFFLVNMYNKMSNSAGMRVQIFDHILVLNGTLWQKKIIFKQDLYQTWKM